MAEAFLVVSILGWLLTLNAVRPVRGSVALLIQSFFASWLTGELALQHIVVQVAGTSMFVAFGALERWPGWLALLLCFASWCSLWLLHREALRDEARFVRAIEEAFPNLPTSQSGSFQNGPLAPMPWSSYLFPLWLSDPRVHVDRDIRYAEGAGRRHLLDIRRAVDMAASGDSDPQVASAKRQKAPVLLQIHGGGWIIGDKSQQGLILVNHLAARGWVCVSINYRLSPRAKWPAHLVDVKLAIKWIRENIEEYGGDPGFIVVTGGSAGGHLTALTALTANKPEYQPGFETCDTRVQAAIPIYAAYDWTNRLKSQKHPGLFWLLELFIMSRRFRDDPTLYDLASPLSHIHEDAPPFFVVHGSNDSLTPIEDARWFVGELRKRSQSPVAFVELPLAQHAFEVFLSPRSHGAAQAVFRFVSAIHASHLRLRPKAEAAAKELVSEAKGLDV